MTRLNKDDLISSFYDALRNQEIVVYYQPITDFERVRCIGAEALVRWRISNGKLLAPDQFLPMAEYCGVIPMITRMVIETIAVDLKDILLSDPGFHVSINFSPSDFESLVTLQLLQRMVRTAGIKPYQIWIEVPEVGFEKTKIAMDVLCKAQDFGFLVALDDFGVGNSGLSCLCDMPLDVLKIDKMFIREIGGERALGKIIGFISDMAHALGLKVVAEGVETENQFEYLKLYHVDYSQGWFHAKAMPCPDFLEYYFYNKRNFAA